MTSRSNQPFLHNPTERPIDRPTDGPGDKTRTNSCYALLIATWLIISD